MFPASVTPRNTRNIAQKSVEGNRPRAAFPRPRPGGLSTSFSNDRSLGDRRCGLARANAEASARIPSRMARIAPSSREIADAATGRRRDRRVPFRAPAACGVEGCGDGPDRAGRAAERAGWREVEGPGWREVGNAVEGFRRRRRVAPREPREAREAARRSRGGGRRERRARQGDGAQPAAGSVRYSSSGRALAEFGR